MSLEFSHIAHAYGTTHALKDVSFTAPSGEITCLLGASGCGKSTLLGLAAGLVPVQSGVIHLNGAHLADPDHSPPPESRPVGLVFQDGALFPHMTIAQNIAFGLGKADRAVIGSWLDAVGLEGLGERYPHQLSGGQQQRAALARAMAPEPEVLLMDEPFASVDVVLRRRLRRECRMILRERGTTSVLVTHDPDEALDIGDRIAVMEAGKIIQFGTPQQLYNTPMSPSVGEIFGGAQIVRARFQNGFYESAFGRWDLSCVLSEEAADGAAESLPKGVLVDLLVQARALRLEPASDGVAVRDIHPLGERARVLLAHSDGSDLTVEIPQAAGDSVSRSARYWVVPDPQSVRVFPADEL